MKRRDFLRHSTLALATTIGGCVTTSVSRMSSSAHAAPAPAGAAPAVAREARSFYVDNAAGNDGGPGTSPQQAWRSIAKLNTVTFRPGDRIYFKRGGDFPGQFKPQGSGSAGQPIVVDSYGSGELPHIHAYGKAQSSLYLHNVEYWVVRNLQVSNKGPAPQGNRAGVYVHLENFGVAHGIVLDKLWVHDVNGSPIKKQGAGAGIMINAAGDSRYDGLQVTNCTVSNCQRNGIHFLAAGNRQHGLARNVLVRGNKIKQVPGDCILVIGCDGALVEHNTVSDGTPLPAGEAAAGIWPFNSDNTLIQYNEVSGMQTHNDGQGFDSDLACDNTIIQYNYSHDNAGGLALVCNMGGKNLGAGNSGTIIRYNVSINDAIRPSGAVSLRVTGPVSGSKIYNNIIIIPRPAHGGGTVFKADDWRGVPDDTAIHDNIILAGQMPAVDMSLDRRTMISGNAVYSAPGGPGLRAAGAGMMAMVAKQAAGDGHGKLLARYASYRPTLSEAVQLVKSCFNNGKPAANAYQLIEQAARLG